MHLLRHIGIASIALSLGACGLVKEPSSPISSCESKAALDAFQSTIYPITTAKCSTCHGRGRPPLLASPTLRRAFNQVVPLVHFDSPDKSKLIKRMTDGHCGANCKVDAEPVIAAIGKWKEREEKTIKDTCGVDPSLIEGPVRQYPEEEPVNARAMRSAPVSLASATLGTFTDISIPLPSPLQGTLILSVERFTNRDDVDSGSYRFSSPRLQVPGSGSAIYLRDMGLSVNDADDNVYTLFSSLDTAVSPGETRSLSGKTTNPIPQLMDAGDTLVVSFFEVRITSVVDCINPNGFRDLVLNGTPGATQANSLTNNCAGCHNANHPRDLSYQIAAGETIEDVCARVVQRINPESPSSSRLVQVPLGGSAGNGAFHRNFSDAPYGPLDVSAWLTWIESERR